jgi:hypothetical protein
MQIVLHCYLAKASFLQGMLLGMFAFYIAKASFCKIYFFARYVTQYNCLLWGRGVLFILVLFFLAFFSLNNPYIYITSLV